MADHSLLPVADDGQKDQSSNTPLKKQKIIEPLQRTETPDDLLAELKAKTNMLTEHMSGVEEARQRILELQSHAGDASSTESILKELNENLSGPSTHEQPKRQSLAVNLDPAETKQKARYGNAAADMIRGKLSKLYSKEPNAKQELIEAEAAGRHRSKHQLFMHELTTSGKSLADIQTEWHNYYVALPDHEKHEVWQEFYEQQHQTSKFTRDIKAHQHRTIQKTPPHNKRYALESMQTNSESRSVGEIKASLADKLSANGKLNAKQHAKSLLFGIGLAATVGVIITFTFFNEVFIAPFISPSRSVSATPIIGDVNGPVGPEPKIIIPKINLEVPVVYQLGTTEEKAIQEALEEGVVHYASTPNPGEMGIAVIVGHSSNNILNQGKYKFAFVLLKRLEPEDTFYIHKDGIRYTYKVFEKRVVSPTDISVLDPHPRGNTITLITCDPPGTSKNRLIIVADQISPDPNNNAASTNTQVPPPAELPSDAPSLWSRIVN